MTKYGSTDSMEKWAWGGTKTATPGVVTEVQNAVTDMINLILNRNEDFATVPTAIDSIANMTGGDILREKGKRTELSTSQIYDQLKVLLMSYMDQSPDDQSRWGNVYYT
jgi:hypothetical protein